MGTFVTTPSRREIVELFEMKELLEGAAVRLLAGRGHVPEVIRLQENVRESDAVAIAGDRERYAQLVEEFHELLIQGSDSAERVMREHVRASRGALLRGLAGGSAAS